MKSIQELLAEQERLKRKLTLLSSIEPEPVPWLWRGWIPRGALTIIQGMTGIGKSTFASDLASRVTIDALMPDGTLCEARGGVIVISYEEVASYRIVPRMAAQGADLDKVALLTIVKRDVNGLVGRSEAKFSMPEDVKALRDAIRGIDASLVVIDPLMSINQGGKRLYGSQATREVLGPLVTIAEDTMTAIVLVNHPRRNGGNPLQGGNGSAEFTNVARSLIVLTSDTGRPENTLVSHVKSSNGPLMPQLTFRNLDGNHIEYIDGLTESQEKKHSQDVLKTANEQVLELVTMFPVRTFTPDEITRLTGLNPNTTKTALRRLVNDKKLALTGRGTYKVA